MKKFVSKYAIAFVFVMVLIGVSAKSVSAQNTINGLVFDQNRKPVPNVYVELLDEYERLIKSVQTNGSGLYFFQNLRGGIFYVTVRTGGTPYRDKRERIQIGESNSTSATTGSTFGAESRQLDIYLEIDPQRRSETPLANEVVFAQEVPNEAKKSFESALNRIDKKDQAKAIEELKQAIGTFPDYFLALNQLGKIYLTQNMFAEAEPIFQRAVNVNGKSFSSLYGLGFSQYKLEKKENALKNLTEASNANPNDLYSVLYIGKIQRELKNFKEAESNFKKVNKLSNNQVADAHWELALLYYYNLKRYSEAADELELFLKANPKAENKEQVQKLIINFREKAKQSD